MTNPFIGNKVFASVEGDEVLFEAADDYSWEFSSEYENAEQVAKIVEAIFLDGARWAIQNMRSTHYILPL